MARRNEGTLERVDYIEREIEGLTHLFSDEVVELNALGCALLDASTAVAVLRGLIEKELRLPDDKYGEQLSLWP